MAKQCTKDNANVTFYLQQLNANQWNFAQINKKKLAKTYFNSHKETSEAEPKLMQTSHFIDSN